MFDLGARRALLRLFRPHPRASCPPVEGVRTSLFTPMAFVLATLWGPCGVFAQEESGRGYTHFLTVGPTIHYTVGSEFPRVTFGLEVSYWFYRYRILEDGCAFLCSEQYRGYGIDAGMEWDRLSWRFYGEGQIGRTLHGISAGPVWEIPHDEKEANHLGLQASLWGYLYLVGFDFRYARIGDENRYGPGIAAKLPIGLARGRYEDEDFSEP